jgi:hypothetical protein
MSSFASDFSQAGPQRDYVSNVGITARAFLKALFAINARPQEAPAATPVSSRKRAKSLMEMHRMANHYESTMPGLASELRCIAARG